MLGAAIHVVAICNLAYMYVDWTVMTVSRGVTTEQEISEKVHEGGLQTLRLI